LLKGKGRDKQSLLEEFSSLADGVQSLVQGVNPLTKSTDYVQEDVVSSRSDWEIGNDNVV